MELLVKRIAKKQSYTIGKLYINGEYFCDTIEDADRGLSQSLSLDYIKRNKKPGITAIPTGTYELLMNISSPKYSNFIKYPWAKEFEGKIPRLKNVPGFDGVLIHVGNKAEDSEGCILVGENKIVGQVINSKATFKKLMLKLRTATDTIYIKII